MATINEKMTSIANAIREKTGKTGKLTLDNMATEIANISTDGEFNFEVVGGTTQPTSPKANTIWVNTDAEITSYIFSVTKPYSKSINKNFIVYPYYNTTNTTNGITYTDLGDGRFSVSGTATANAYFRASYDSADKGAFLLSAGTYTLSGCIVGGSAETYMLQLMQQMDDGTWGDLVFDYGDGVTFTLNRDTVCCLSFCVMNGVTVSNLTGYFQLEEGSDATSFIKGEAKEGVVWFETGTNSPADFNALVSNGMMVYPNHVEHYTNGAWMPKEGHLYDGEKWTQFAFLILWLYRNGDRSLGVTGDYHQTSPDSTTIPPDGQTADGIKYLDFPCRGDENGLYKAIQFYTGKMIDITAFNYLVEKSIHGRSGDDVQIVSSDLQVAAWVDQTQTTNDMQTLVLDISELTGPYYIGFYNFNNGYDNWDMYELYLTAVETEDIVVATATEN